MPTRDWYDAPFVRVYSTLSRDHPGVWRDDRLLAWYVRLLMTADLSWPGVANLPRALPDDVLETLVEDEIVEPDGDVYRFHGLDDERNGRARRGHQGGVVRSSTARRTPLGRFAGGSLDDTSVVAGTGSLVNGAGAPASPASSAPANPARQTDRHAGTTSVSRLSPRAPADAREEPAQDDDDPSRIDCDDYDAHRAEHRLIAGRWRCVVCERARADFEPSFRERVARYSDAEGPF